MVMQNIRQKSAAAVAVMGMGAMLVGCAAAARPESVASFGARGELASPKPLGGEGGAMSVSCEPNQRAIVRQANGAAVSVACVTVGGYGAAGQVAYQSGMPSAVPLTYTQPVALDNTRVVRTAYPVTRGVAAGQRVVYQPASARVVVRKPKRSVQKSALIIGGSAAGGAGLGAAIGGKKGALIGALLGGGGATVWDQITRHKQ